MEHKIIQNENLAMGRYPHKKWHLLGTFTFQIPFQGKLEGVTFRILREPDDFPLSYC